MSTGKKEKIAYAETPAEWSRIPRNGRTLEGLYRSQLHELIKSGQVRSVGIKPAGATKVGVRLIHTPSLRAWIAAQGETTEVKPL
jgi:hypothetical protein